MSSTRIGSSGSCRTNRGMRRSASLRSSLVYDPIHSLTYSPECHSCIPVGSDCVIPRPPSFRLRLADDISSPPLRRELGREGNDEVEDRAGGAARLDPDATTVRLDEPASDGQAEADASIALPRR